MNEQIHIEEERSLHHYRTEIPNCIFDAKLSPTEFLLYCHIKRIAGDKGKCFMSHKHLAESCAVSEKTVRTCLLSLCEKNEILGVYLLKKKIRKKENGSLDTCLYTIVDLWPLNMSIYSQNSFGTVKYTEGVRQNLPEGTVKFTDKEEHVKKNTIKNERSARENVQKTDRKKREIPHFIKIEGLSPKDQQMFANMFTDAELAKALEDTRSYHENKEKVKNIAAFMMDRAKFYRDKSNPT
jgi:hypothetical protein